MVVELASHGRRRVDNLDPVLRQGGGISDAGQHQQLRALEHARAQDDLGARPHLAVQPVLPVLDPNGALAFKDDASRLSMEFDAQVRTCRQDRLEIGPRGAAALPAPHGRLIGAQPFLVRAIEVL